MNIDLNKIKEIINQNYSLNSLKRSDDELNFCKLTCCVVVRVNLIGDSELEISTEAHATSPVRKLSEDSISINLRVKVTI